MPIAQPALLFLIIAVTGCTKFQLLNATIPTWGYTKTPDIPYGPLPRQKLDVYQPPHAKNADIVLFLYGGDWQTGSRQDYRFVAHALISRGFIAVMPDYRLYPDVTFPAFVYDAASAIRWMHDHAADFGGNPSHIYLMGHSAGAHIAALLTLDPRYLASVGLDRDAIRATAALSGPYDFEPAPEDRAVFQIPPDQRRPAPAAEPINFVDGHAPPMLLIHGTKDQTVEIENADHLAERIRSAGGRVDCIRYEGKGHVPVVLGFAWPFRWIVPTLADITRFFRAQDQPQSNRAVATTRPTPTP